jgi:hypothetical protein
VYTFKRLLTAKQFLIELTMGSLISLSGAAPAINGSSGTLLLSPFRSICAGPGST